MKRIYATIAVLSILTAITFWSQPTRSQSQSGAANALGVNSNITQIGGVSVNNDPCGSWGVVKTSAVITAPAAATTQIVAGVAGQTIFVCGYQMSQAVLAGTLQWTSGTGGACGAATVLLSGAMQTIVGQPFLYGGGEMSVMSTAAGSGICITTTGAGATAAGLITYVQRVAGT